MKTACLVFLMIGSAALGGGKGYAAESGPGSAGTVGGSLSDTKQAAPAGAGNHRKVGVAQERDDRRASDKSHARSNASLASAKRPQPLLNQRKPFAPANGRQASRPDPAKSGPIARGESVQNETAKSLLPVRPPGVFRPAVLSPENPRHRGPNPALIDGRFANAKNGSAGSVNGTVANRKP